MQSATSASTSAKSVILKIIKAKHPATVGELAEAVLVESEFDEHELIQVLKDMAKEGSLPLSKPSYELESAWDYLFTVTLSGWFWGTMSLTALAVLSVVFVPDLFPVNVIRWVLGSVFVLYLPGHTLITALFPRGREMDAIERFALSIGLSLALVPLIGLVLNYTPWGIRLGPIVASLSGFTVLMAVAAASREYAEVQKTGQVGQ